MVTLFGGFASTVCWPLSAFLAARYGWRDACFTYAAIRLIVALPIHLLRPAGRDDDEHRHSVESGRRFTCAATSTQPLGCWRQC